MNCDDLREHYDLYALGIAEDPERGEIRIHLARECEVCLAALRRSLETVALIGTSAPQSEPRPQLRRRVLASVAPEEQRPSWVPTWAWTLAMAALFAATVYFAVSSREYAREAGQLRRQMRRQSSEIARLTEAFAIVSGPNTTEATFGGSQPRPPRGKVFVNPSRGVLLIASNLPPTPADKIYEMWIIRKGAQPVPAGLFQSQDNGNALHMRPGALDVASTAAVAVTVESAGGADQPTTQPLIVAPIASSAH